MIARLRIPQQQQRRQWQLLYSRQQQHQHQSDVVMTTTSISTTTTTTQLRNSSCMTHQQPRRQVLLHTQQLPSDRRRTRKVYHYHHHHHPNQSTLAGDSCCYCCTMSYGGRPPDHNNYRHNYRQYKSSHDDQKYFSTVTAPSSTVTASTTTLSEEDKNNHNNTYEGDVDEIDTTDIATNDTQQSQLILSSLSPLPLPKDTHIAKSTNDSAITTKSPQRQPRQYNHTAGPKATAQIEFDNDDSYYNDYCSIMENDLDLMDDGDHHHQQQQHDPATNTMSTVSAIAQGTYSAASYYGNLSPTLGYNNSNNSANQGNFQPQQQTGAQNNNDTKNQQQQPRQKYNIYDLDAAMIREITNIEDVADVVTQIENMATIEANDVEPLLIPLSRITSRKKYGEVGAKLTERLLLTCLGRLPITIFDRYTKKVTFVESTIPNKFSTVLDTREWIPTTTDTATIISDDGRTTTGSNDATNDTIDNKTEQPPLQNILTKVAAPRRIRSTLSYPTQALYNRAIIAWGNLANGAGLMRAESMFQLQIEEYVRELEFVRYHQMKNRQQEMKNLRDPASNVLPFQGLNPELQLPPEPFAPPPGRTAYKSLIRAWAVSGDKNAAAKSYELLREMEQLSGVQEILQQPRDTSLRPLPPIPPIDMPDIGTYNVVLSAYAKSNVLQHPIVLERVKKIAQRIRDLHVATGSDEYYFNSYTYIAILQTYRKYVSACGGTLEYKYLDEIYGIIRNIHGEIERRKHLPPDYQDRMHAIKRNMDDNKVPQKNQRDLAIFFPMSMSWTYGVLVDALLKSTPLYRTIFIADDIVTAMTGRTNRINTPATTSGFDANNLNTVGTLVPLYIPNAICTNTWPQYDTLMQVVEGWGRSGLPQANERIEQLIQIVVADAYYPRIFYLHEAMDSWCNSTWPFAPHIVENLLQRALEKASHVQNKPTGQTFAIAFKAWIKSDKPDAPYRAEMLLQHLLHLYEVQEDSWYKPREVHLRYLLTNWLNRCKTGETYDGIGGNDLYPAEHIEKLVYWIRHRSWFQQHAEAMYGMAIRAWALQVIPDTDNDAGAEVVTVDMKNIADDQTSVSMKKKSTRTLPPPNSVEHALQLLHSFATLMVSTNDLVPPYPCNWLLETCCQVQSTMERKIQVYETAIQTFQRCRHNARTYVLLVKVIRIQVPEDKFDDAHRTLIEELFNKCCIEGLVSQDLIVQVVSTAKSPETIQRLFGLSYQIAQLILQQRDAHVSGYVIYNKNGKSNGHKMDDLKNYDRLPSSLQVHNLPAEWSANVGSKKQPNV